MKIGLLTAALCVLAPSAVGREAPLPGCFDGRAVREAVQSDAHTLAVRLDDGARYRVDLGTACPGVTAHPDARLVSAGGWVCGRTGDYVVAGERACPVAFVFPIDAAAFAAHAVQGAESGARTLDRVVVTAPRRRSFRGTTAYCLDARWMRGWHEDHKGLVVEVSPKRSGGNRYYRVELEAGCARGDAAHSLQLVSRIGGAMICGLPGDVAVFSTEAEQNGLANALALSRVSHFARAGANGCAVALVYPIEPNSNPSRIGSSSANH